MRAVTWILAMVMALLDIVWLAFTLRLWMLRHEWEIKQRFDLPAQGMPNLRAHLNHTRSEMLTRLYIHAGIEIRITHGGALSS